MTTRTIIGYHQFQNAQLNDAQTQAEWFRLQGIDRAELLRTQARQMANIASMAELQETATRKRFAGTPVFIPPARRRPLDECRVITRPPAVPPSFNDKAMACALVCYAIAIAVAITVWL